MRSNKKGFTLIELLAVIVILAIIALIATPIVLGIIEKARKSAAEDSVYGVMEAIKLAYTESLLNDPVSLPMEVVCEESGCFYEDGETKLDFAGTAPTAGTITLTSGGSFSDTTDVTVDSIKCKITSGKVSCGEE